MKKILLFLLAFLAAMFVANGAEFYSIYEISHVGGPAPTTVYVEGHQCANSGCTASTAPINDVVIYKGDAAISCLSQGLSGAITVPQMNTCLSSARITNGIVPLGSNKFVVTKVTTPSTHGHLTYFSANDDEYIPHIYNTFNYVCSFDVCVDTLPAPVQFEKKENAIAEIQQFNVVNTDNPLLPVQITVPVELSQTVCSAFQVTNPTWFLPTYPASYSDHSALTTVDLTISNLGSGTIYATTSTTIDIPADTCTGTASFTWTPPAGLVDETVKFRVETDVIDSQVSSSIVDFAEVIETIYPLNLTNACYATMSDLTLSNSPSFNITPSLTEIVLGEPGYVLFNAAAFSGNTTDPIDFNVKVFYDGALVYEDNKTAVSSLTTYSVDITSAITAGGTGTHGVRVEITPLDPSCTLTSTDIQTLNVEVKPVPLYEVTFIVRDTAGNRIDNAQVDFELITALGSPIVPPTFDETQFTDINGITIFDDVFYGEYEYVVGKSGFSTKTNDVTIGSNTTIIVTLDNSNAAPVVNLPANFTEKTPNTIVFDVRPYITDVDDAFSSLIVTWTQTSGTCIISFDGIFFTITSGGSAKTCDLKVTAEDPSGAMDMDTTTIIFNDNNAPDIVKFFGVPDVGFEPLDVNFSVEVFDADGDPLTCTLDFGDNISITTTSCPSLDGIPHTYVNDGIYTATLTVTDGIDTTVLTEVITVLENTTTPNNPPIILAFFAVPDVGFEPLDTVFTVSVFDPDFDPLTCTLDFGDNSTPAVSTGGSCTSLHGTPHTYVNDGIYTATLTVTDGINTTVLTEIIVVLENVTTPNNPPIIVDFFAVPDTGFEPLDTVFTVTVVDPDFDPLTCTLDFGDNSTPAVSTGGSCTSLHGTPHTYVNDGIYTATLTVTDGINTTVMTEVITVLENVTSPMFEPVLNSFDVVSSNGAYVPTNLSIAWNVTHTGGFPMTCTLTAPTIGAIIVPCIGTFDIIGFDTEGTHTFKIHAIDNQTKEVEGTIIKSFDRMSPLSTIKPMLIIDYEIYKHQFDFQIKVQDEDMKRRLIEVRPTIICRGDSVNHLRDPVSGKLMHSAVSMQHQEDPFLFNFVTSTRDFELHVPTGEKCLFRVELWDQHGSFFVLEEYVKFVYPEAERKISSIRGHSTDIVNYMYYALGGVERGYNVVEFSVDNRVGTAKDIEISLMSRELGISFTDQEDLDGGDVRSVGIPVYIPNNQEPGMYPIRISVFDGEQKQVRYAYIRLD